MWKDVKKKVFTEFFNNKTMINSRLLLCEFVHL